ncbi:MAG: antitoxin VapB family protein [Sulfolobales archaeon]
MRRYTTISVLKEVKDLLAKDKGDMDWSSFLLDLYREAKRGRAKESFNELRRLLSDEDLESVIKSSEEFRRRFRFR